MACAQPIKIENPHYNLHGYTDFWKQYLEVPCGKCLNCRIDKQNWITDACDYEFRKYDYIGSFVTLTYDDNHLIEKSNIVPDDFYQFKDDDENIKTIPFINDRICQYSLSRDDFRNFLKRLRSKINYYYKKHNINNVDLCKKNFKFLGCGEYGDLFGRPHYHFVFFGLDYNFCKYLIKECWEFGLIDVLPIKDGAFRYISKYFTKQLKGERAEEVYDKQNLERPFFTHSLGLGKGIILEQKDYIIKTKGLYKNFDNLLRPIPIYYRNILKIRPKIDFEKTSENMLQAGITTDIEYNPSIKYRYSIKKMNEFKKAQAILRHQKLEKQLENSGQSSYKLLFYYNTSEEEAIKLSDEAYYFNLSVNKFKTFDDFVSYCDSKSIIPF